ncbi:MAG: hypothetical protein IJ888_09040 [Prevotella sp.]|nr:hypothetical protein [Prevotella sp.]MCR5712963.1 hypothetical protein [Prevotella sp.]
MSDACGNSQMYDKELMQRIVNNVLERGNGMITARQFQALSGLRYHSARQCLDDLCGGESPILQRDKMGRTYVYYRK